MIRRVLLLCASLLVVSVPVRAEITGIFTFADGSDGAVQFSSGSIFASSNTFNFRWSSGTLQVPKIQFPDGTVQISSSNPPASTLELFNNSDGTRLTGAQAIGFSGAFNGTFSGSTYTARINFSSVAAQSDLLNYLPLTSTPTFLSTITAASTYLTQSSATATYFNINSTVNFVSQSSATSNLLSLSSAAATYAYKNGIINLQNTLQSGATFYVSSGNVQGQLNVTTLTAIGQLIGRGTPTNDSAAAGYIGEEIIATRVRSARHSLVTNVPSTVTANGIALTPGDWDISAEIGFESDTATSVTERRWWINTSPNATVSDDRLHVGANGVIAGLDNKTAHVGVAQFTGILSPQSVRLTTSTTYYLNANSAFTISTMQVWGTIRARRVR